MTFCSNVSLAFGLRTHVYIQASTIVEWGKEEEDKRGGEARRMRRREKEERGVKHRKREREKEEEKDRGERWKRRERDGC